MVRRTDVEHVVCGVTTDSIARLRDRPPVAPASAGMLVADGVATGSASRASRRRAAAHAVVGVAGWLLLGVLWLWQMKADHVPAQWLPTVGVVVGGGVLFAAFCMVWVSWNVGIYRRRHNRRTPIIYQVQFESDALGREIVAPVEGRVAPHLVIEIDEASSRKHYVVA